MKTNTKMALLAMAAASVVSVSAVASGNYVVPPPIFESAPGTVPVQPDPFDAIIGGDDYPPVPGTIGTPVDPVPEIPEAPQPPKIDDGTKGACVGISGWCVGVSW